MRARIVSKLLTGLHNIKLPMKIQFQTHHFRLWAKKEKKITVKSDEESKRWYKEITFVAIQDIVYFTK